MHTVIRSKIEQITILNEIFSLNFYNTKNQYSRGNLTPLQLQVAELKNKVFFSA